MTRYGVEHDLKKSPYIYDSVYGNVHYQFCFSTKNNLDKFINEMKNNRKIIRESLQNRFKMKFILGDDFCDIQLYKKIERRGFLVSRNGVCVEWLGKLSYDGQKLILNDSSEK